MHNIITKKYPSLKALDIEGGYMRSGVSRDELWDIMLELKIPLTKEQKAKIEYEKNFRILKGVKKIK